MAHILLIEPDAILSELYKRMYVTEGYTVASVKNAENAIHAADVQIPDLVILELQLVGHSGVEFLYEFRSYPEWQDVPVIVHTSLGYNELKQFDTALSQLAVAVCLHKNDQKPRTLLAISGRILEQYQQ
jgi:DNA-binding response OmpR family regulator